MSEADRRFQRFVVDPDAFRSQRIRKKGLLGSILGWKLCSLRDISNAGALVITHKLLTMGTPVMIELETNDGESMTLSGEVVNIALDHGSCHFRLGIKIMQPEAQSSEGRFLSNLDSHFQPSL